MDKIGMTVDRTQTCTLTTMDTGQSRRLKFDYQRLTLQQSPELEVT